MARKMMPAGGRTLRCWGSKARITGHLDRTHKICTAYSPSFFEATRPLAASSAKLSGATAREARHGRHAAPAAPARARLFATLASDGGLKKSEDEGPLPLYGAGSSSSSSPPASTSADQQPPARKSVSVTTIRGKHRRGEPLSMLTAYDYPSARLADRAGVDILLVGDSLGMVVLGYDSTTPVTMDEMLHHSKAVARGSENCFKVGDLPFGAYLTPEDAMRNSVALVKDANM